jgi:hypothetical protein
MQAIRKTPTSRSAKPLVAFVVAQSLLFVFFLSQSTASWRMHGSGHTSGIDFKQSFSVLWSGVKYVRNV